jgi:hypothetical protein
VGIDIPRLLLNLRNDLTHAHRAPFLTSQALRLWYWAMSDSARYRRLANILATTGQLPGHSFWSLLSSRAYGIQSWPAPARRPFHQRWQADA